MLHDHSLLFPAIQNMSVTTKQNLLCNFSPFTFLPTPGKHQFVFSLYGLIYSGYLV